MIENYSPNKVAVFFGKTGVGKTSTINLLFNQTFETDNAAACTKELQFATFKEHLIIDIPGIAESEIADKKYFNEYIKAVKGSSLIIWVLQGDTRVYRPDQVMLLKLKEYFRAETKFLICINQIDLIGTANWDISKNEPSEDQKNYINEKREDILKKFVKYMPNLEEEDIITHSVTQKYNTDVLFDHIINQDNETI